MTYNNYKNLSGKQPKAESCQDFLGHFGDLGEGRCVRFGAACVIACVPITMFPRTLPYHHSNSIIWCVNVDSRSIYVYLCFSGSGEPKVYRQSFWMRGWGAKTAKRTTLWSNSTGIRFFSTTAKVLSRNGGKLKLADTYFDKQGRKRYKGNANLRSSQSWPY